MLEYKLIIIFNNYKIISILTGKLEVLGLNSEVGPKFGSLTKQCIIRKAIRFNNIDCKRHFTGICLNIC